MRTILVSRHDETQIDDAEFERLAMDITRLIYAQYGQRFDVQLRL